VAGSGFPFNGLLHQLEIQRAAHEGLTEPQRAQELQGGDVDVLGVAGVEHDFLGVALAVADAEVVAERGGHHAYGMRA